VRHFQVFGEWVIARGKWSVISGSPNTPMGSAASLFFIGYFFFEALQRMPGCFTSYVPYSACVKRDSFQEFFTF
jgi:hypothetical protein